MIKKYSGAQLLAHFISIVLHPVFVPVIAYILMYLMVPYVFFGLSEKNVYWWLLIIAYINVTFPLLVVFLLWRLGFISSMHMQGLKERYVPLIASMLFYFWTFWIFYKQLNAPQIIQVFLAGVFLTSVAVFMASIFYKISMHTAAWGTVCSMGVILLMKNMPGASIFFVVVLLLAGLAGSARLYLKAHTPFEVYSGYAVGMLSQIISFIIIKQL